MKRLLMGAVALALLSLPARADPLLTPLVSSALLGAGVAEGAGITVASTLIPYASLVTYTLTAGPVLYPSRIEVRP